MTSKFFEIRDGQTLLYVRATTKASKNAIVGVKNNRLAISVTAAPENGKANEAIVKLLSKQLKLAKSKIQLAAGEKSQNKTICISEILEELEDLVVIERRKQL